MSNVVEHTSCPSCPSSDGRAVYEDGTSYCFVCQTYFPSEDNNESTPEYSEDSKMPIVKEVEYSCRKVMSYPINPIEGRGINQATAEKYGIRVQYNTTTGEPVSYYFPRYKDGVLTGYKVRRADKKAFYSVGDTKSPDFFGQNTTNNKGKMVLITEGEIDALSAYQMFKEKGKEYRVWSLPDGANTRAVKQNIEILEAFDSVILALDQDKVGQECAREIAELLSPGKVRIMTFSEKDANDMLKKGKSDEWYKLLTRA